MKEESLQIDALALDWKLMQSRKIVLSGEIEKQLTAQLIKQLFILEALGPEPIELFIDSPGGDADAGLAVYDCINYLRVPVHTIGMGLVASAAAIIFLAPQETSRRFSLPNARYLIHQPSSSMRGVASDIEIYAREIEQLKERLNQLVAERTGHSRERVREHSDRDYWMSAQEALEYGLLGSIV